MHVKEINKKYKMRERVRTEEKTTKNTKYIVGNHVLMASCIYVVQYNILV